MAALYRGEEVTVHNTSISLLLSITSVWVLLSPPIEVERLDQWLNVPVHGWCGKRRFFFFLLFYLFNRTITIFLNKFQYEKKKCSDEEAQEKPQGLCELSFLKI